MAHTFRRHRALLFLCTEVFVIMLGLGLVIPILPLYARTFGVGATGVGFLVAVFGISRMLINIPAGHWTERFGRRALLVIGPLITSLGSFGFAFADSFAALVIWRTLQGFGSALVTTSSMVVLADVSQPHNRGRMMSLFQGSLLLGAGAGPALGGVIAGSLGLRFPFIIFGILTLVAALWAFRQIPETRDWESIQSRDQIERVSRAVTAHFKDTRTGYNIRQFLRDRNFLLVSSVALAVFFTRSGGQMTLLPLFGHDIVRLSEGMLGMSFTIIALANFATLYTAGWLSDRFGRKSVIVPSGFLTALVMWLYFYCDTQSLFLVNSFFLGIGIGLSGAAPAAYAADIVPTGRVGPAMGLFRTFGDLGFVIGPVLLGWVMDTAGFGPAFMVNAALLLVTTLAFSVLARESRSH